MRVHFSIDDVNSVFKECADNRYNSIFEHEFFRYLSDWHDRYRMKVSLYLIQEVNGFAISEISERYRKDFYNNCEWLLFGFHSRTVDPVIKDNESDFINAFHTVTENIRFLEMGGGDEYYQAT